MRVNGYCSAECNKDLYNYYIQYIRYATLISIYFHYKEGQTTEHARCTHVYNVDWHGEMPTYLVLYEAGHPATVWDGLVRPEVDLDAELGVGGEQSLEGLDLEHTLSVNLQLQQWKT